MPLYIYLVYIAYNSACCCFLIWYFNFEFLLSGNIHPYCLIWITLNWFIYQLVDYIFICGILMVHHVREKGRKGLDKSFL